MGADRKITVTKELTKKHETKLPFTLEEAIAYFTENDPKGEFVLVLEGIDKSILKEEEQKKFEEMTLEEHMAIYENQGIARKEAMKLVAKDRGISKRDVYNALLD